MLLFTAYIPRGVFVRILRENPELHGETAFFAVSVHRGACYGSRNCFFQQGRE